MSGVQDKGTETCMDRLQTEGRNLTWNPGRQKISAYDNLGNAAYLRAKEDYLMGINFSRALTLKYGNTVKGISKETGQ